MKNPNNPSFLTSIRNRQGVTLVEAVLAMGLVAVIALGSLSFFSDVAKFSSRSLETCRLHNLSFLNQLRSYGTVASIWNYLPTASTDNVITSSIAGTQSFSSPSEAAASRWPPEAILGATTEPLVNNYLLINGNMNVIQAIYNGHPGICDAFTNIGTAPTAFSALRLLTPNPTPTELDVRATTQTTVQIIPYSLSDGNYLGCAGNSSIKIAPRGKYLTDTAPGSPFTGAIGTQLVTRPVDVRTDLGFAVKVRTQFTDAKGNIDECRTEQRFQYDIDNDAPVVPQNLDVTLTSGIPPVCDAQDHNTYQLALNYSSSMEPGTVLLCKDASTLPTTLLPTIDGFPTAKIACYNGLGSATGNAPTGLQPSVNNGSTYFPASPTEGFYDYTSAGAKGIVNWVPCYKLTLCQKAPTLVTSTASPRGYTITYDNVPSDCRIMVQVVAVDTAANPSAVLNSANMANATISTLTNWDVPRPKCRAYCPVTAWPDGYYTCNPTGC